MSARKNKTTGCLGRFGALFPKSPCITNRGCGTEPRVHVQTINKHKNRLVARGNLQTMLGWFDRDVPTSSQDTKKTSAYHMPQLLFVLYSYFFGVTAWNCSVFDENLFVFESSNSHEINMVLEGGFVRE